MSWLRPHTELYSLQSETPDNYSLFLLSAQPVSKLGLCHRFLGLQITNLDENGDKPTNLKLSDGSIFT